MSRMMCDEHPQPHFYVIKFNMVNLLVNDFHAGSRQKHLNNNIGILVWNIWECFD